MTDIVDGAVVDDTVRDAWRPKAAVGRGDPGRPSHVARGSSRGAEEAVFDPEIPVNIYELGLIYKIDIDAENNVALKMTLTAPGCPVAGEMPEAGAARRWSAVWTSVSATSMSSWSGSRAGTRA